MSSLKELPEFASLCSFIQLFGEELNVTLSHCQLSKFLEITDADNVPKIWIDIHRRLLSRIKYRCSIDKWEGTLKKCLVNVLGYESELANLNGTNYFGISAENRAKILNILFDCQFDKNIKFKEKVNLKLISDLRTQPFGSDIHGCIYWLFVDIDISIIMYKENLEEESFKIVAESLEDLNNILKELSEVDCEKVNLSQLYSVNSPSDDVDHSRNQSPILDNISGILEKATNKLIPTKMETNDLSVDIKNEGIDTEIDYSTNEPILDDIQPKSEEILKIETETENDKITTEICTSESMPNENLNKNANSCVSPEKSKKKLGRKQKEISPCNEDESNANIGLRRSERKRKPVNLFSITYSDSCKKMKRDVPKTENHSSKKIKETEKKLHKKSKEKRKKGRPKKSTEFSLETGKEKKKLKKNKKKHEKGKKHKKHKSKNPWENAESSDDHNNDAEEEDEVYLNEESEGSISIKETWDDKPESDFDPDKISISSDEETSKARGRNYFRQKSYKKEKHDIDDKPCQICLKNNIPEMILLCDDCDFGHHAMCLKPSLMIIPEGEWFCPKCQHKKLINKLSEKITELEKSMVKNTAKMRMQERLNFVNISMSNILSKSQERKQIQKSCCESESGSLTDCNSSSGSLSSSSGSYNSSDNSSKSGSKATRTRYKFRETSRKENTKYNFEEIDKMFDDALEHDEKYKLLKKEQESRDRRNSESSRGEESEPEYDYSGIEPRKKSSGKDMANIVNEDEEQMPARPMVKKKRLKYISDEDYEDDIKDTDFKLSDQSDSELDEYECPEANGSNCSDDDDDDWVVSRKRVTRKATKKKYKHRSVLESSGGYSRPRRNATRNINYRNMVGDEDEDEDEEPGDKSPEYESDDSNRKPPPVVSRKKDKHSGLIKKRIISDSEYEENSKSESIADSGSTEKLEVVKRKFKPDLNSDSEDEQQVTKVPIIDNEDNDASNDYNNDLIIDIKSSPISNIPIYPSLAILNPMRAKADEDDDVENEVESETECDLTISMSSSQDLNNQNTAPKV